MSRQVSATVSYFLLAFATYGIILQNAATQSSWHELKLLRISYSGWISLSCSHRTQGGWQLIWVWISYRFILSASWQAVTGFSNGLLSLVNLVLIHIWNLGASRSPSKYSVQVLFSLWWALFILLVKSGHFIKQKSAQKMKTGQEGELCYELFENHVLLTALPKGSTVDTGQIQAQTMNEEPTSSVTKKACCQTFTAFPI